MCGGMVCMHHAHSLMLNDQVSICPSLSSRTDKNKKIKCKHTEKEKKKKR